MGQLEVYRFARRHIARSAAILMVAATALLIATSFHRSEAEEVAAEVNGLAPTPPMGWASWNHFFCDYTDKTIRQQTDALVSSGMRDLGYKYVIIQECIAPSRDQRGDLIIDSKRFPHGMNELVDYIHSRGLKAGIYTDAGKYTCFPGPRYQGSYGHEDQDAATFASWGMDLVEMDYCDLPEGQTGRAIYQRMSQSIRKTGRPMLFYICSWGNEAPWEWAQGSAQLWRTDRDISAYKDQVEWKRMVENFESNSRQAVFSAPNGWNDPDMIEVGNHGLTDIEQYSHFNMWVISAAPLWSGADLTKLDPVALEIYTNREAVAVDQDPLGVQATKLPDTHPGLEVWIKPLQSEASGKYAVLLINLTDASALMKVDWADLNLSGRAEVRDLWKHKEVGQSDSGYQTTLRSHESALLTVSGTFSWNKGAVYEAEWPGNIRTGQAALLTCGECSRGYAVALHGGESNDRTSLKFTHIGVSEAGKYNLQIFYVRNGLSDDTTLEMQINGDSPSKVVLPQHIYASVQVPIELREGENTITFRFGGKGNVYLDQIRLYR